MPEGGKNNMSKRDLIKLAEELQGQHSKNKYLSCYDLSMDEMNSLYELSLKNPVKALTIAFEAGIVVGGRARGKNRFPAL